MAMRTRPLFDVAALLARLGVGIVFLAHGWQKIQVGITATADSFDRLDVPAPTAAAIYATFAELLGGLALIAGLGLPVAGTALFLDMAGAFVFVHAGDGIFLVDQGENRNGFELVLVLGLASLLFAAGGGGRLSLDHRLFPRRPAGAPTAPPPPLPTVPPPPDPTPEPAVPEPRGKRPSAGIRRKRAGTQDAAQPPAPAPAPAPAQQNEPAGDDGTPPRLASDIIGDTGEDVHVAGRRRPRRNPGPGS